MTETIKLHEVQGSADKTLTLDASETEVWIEIDSPWSGGTLLFPLTKVQARDFAKAMLAWSGDGETPN